MKVSHSPGCCWLNTESKILPLSGLMRRKFFIAMRTFSPQIPLQTEFRRIVNAKIREHFQRSGGDTWQWQWLQWVVLDGGLILARPHRGWGGLGYSGHWTPWWWRYTVNTQHTMRVSILLFPSLSVCSHAANHGEIAATRDRAAWYWAIVIIMCSTSWSQGRRECNR